MLSPPRGLWPSILLLLLCAHLLHTLPLSHASSLTSSFLTSIMTVPSRPLSQLLTTTTSLLPPPDDLPTFKPLLFPLLSSFPELDWLFVGFNDGTFTGYTHHNATSITLTEKSTPDGPLSFYTVDPDSSIPTTPHTPTSTTTYDPLTRPWWNATHSSGTWSSVYAFSLPNSPLGLTLSKPLPNIGVIGTDYLLSGLSKKLAAQFPEADGLNAYIVEEGSHYLIASSLNEVHLTTRNNDRVTAKNCTSSFIRQSIKWLVTEGYVPPIGWESHLTFNPSKKWSDSELYKAYKDVVVAGHNTLTERGVFNSKMQSYGLSDVEVSFWEAAEGLDRPRWIVVMSSKNLGESSFISKNDSPNTYAYFLGCSIYIACLSLVFILFTVGWRNTNILRISQPTFLGLLASSGLLFSLAILFLVGPPTPFYCATYLFLPNIAFTFSFSCLLWKIHRAYLVAQAVKNLKKIQFSNADVYLYIGSVTLLDVALQGVSILVESEEVGYERTCKGTDAEGSCIEIDESLTCVPRSDKFVMPLINSHPFFAASALMKVVMVAFGVKLAWNTKRFDRQYAESNALLLTCYTVAISGALICFTQFFIGVSGQLKVWAGVITYNVTFSLLCVFLPRVFSLFIKGDITTEELYARTKKTKIQRRSLNKQDTRVGGGSNVSTRVGGDRTKASPGSPESGARSPMRQVEKKKVVTVVEETEEEAAKKKERRGSLVERRTTRGKSVFAPSAVAMGTDMDDVFFEEMYGGAEDDGRWQAEGVEMASAEDVVEKTKRSLEKRKSKIQYKGESAL